MKLPFPFIKSTHIEQQKHQQAWPWPSCGNSTKTLSFRSTAAATTTADMFRTINSTYEEMDTTTIESSISPQLNGNLVDSEDDTVIQGAINRKQSQRLFFSPGKTNSILEEAKGKNVNENVSMGVVMEEMESINPYVDFRKSMEEMLEANERLKESMEGLQELLSCYLTINGRENHGYIFGAFLDLLTSLSFNQEDEENHNNNGSSLSTNSPFSALSFTSNASSCTSSTARSTTPCLSCSVEEEEGGGAGVESTSSSRASERTLVVLFEEDNVSPSCSSHN